MRIWFLVCVKVPHGQRIQSSGSLCWKRNPCRKHAWYATIRACLVIACVKTVIHWLFLPATLNKGWRLAICVILCLSVSFSITLLDFIYVTEDIRFRHDFNIVETVCSLAIEKLRVSGWEKDNPTLAWPSTLSFSMMPEWPGHHHRCNWNWLSSCSQSYKTEQVSIE